MTDPRYGFVRVATATPKLRVADTKYNAAQISNMIKTRARQEQVDILVFPELSLTGYTCADLFQQKPLRDGAIEALLEVAKATKSFEGLVFVGLPLEVDNQLFNCAAALSRGKVLGIVPKSFIPNYKEFYESRWFSPAAAARSTLVIIGGQKVPFGTDLLFTCKNVPGLVVGAEICEDLWTPIPPSCFQALAGATVLVNLSASNEVIGKAGYRRGLVSQQAGRCMAVYAYASCGVRESTTDVVFGGHCLISKNGGKPLENQRFERYEVMLVTDCDLDALIVDRLRTNSFAECMRTTGGTKEFRHVSFTLGKLYATRSLRDKVSGSPFVPSEDAQLNERCEEIFSIQVAGICKRLETIATPLLPLPDEDMLLDDLTDEQKARIKVSIGVSGGLDSTLALIATCKAFDLLGVSRANILGFTMPGFGTTKRTKNNAHRLMKGLGITAREVDIRKMCFEEMLATGYKPFGIDLTGLTMEQFEEKLKELPDGAQDLGFENVQARMRTLILMNAGFVIGTGDLSELAKGWCTFNADHMSMYNPNASIPKTLVKFLVRWAALAEFKGEVSETLLDIFGTEISPELLPTGKNGEIKQKTEDMVGPYELTDFILYYVIRFGFGPEKILYLMDNAQFSTAYTSADFRRWLRDFVERFFRQQFKRSTLPDGPKVGSISLSPRGDWRMPSDASATLWLQWLSRDERLQPKRQPVPVKTTEPVPAVNHQPEVQTMSSSNATISGDSAARCADCTCGPTRCANCSCAGACGGSDVAATASVPVRCVNCTCDGTACVNNDVAPVAPAQAVAANEPEKVVRALGIIDAQNDFGSKTHNNGAGLTAQLPVEGGEEIGAGVGRLQEEGDYDVIFSSRDDHPADMFNFTSQNPDKSGYTDTVADEDGVQATVYPDHCVKGTWGADYLPGVRKDLIAHEFTKGTTRTKDSYSVCGNADCIPTLSELGVTHIDLVGLVFRICVGYSAIDLARAGFKVRVITDLTRDLPIDAFQPVIDEMNELGVEFVTLADVLSGR